MSSSPIGLDARSWREGILEQKWSVREAIEASLARVAAFDGELRAFGHVDAEDARSRADRLDAALAAGEPPGPLFGVPVALKANMCLEGAEVNCGSRLLGGYRPPYTATFVQRLEEAGAIPFGMTNMDEFAMGSSCENSAFECARNPWDSTRTPGGSSGGSAVAVAADYVPIALGSDTGGSVRQPGALCGVLGFKPTYGRVSRYGLVAFGSSLDQVSPLAHRAADLELVMEAISGHDERDSTSLPLPPVEPERPAEEQRLVGLRIGVPAEYFSGELDVGVRDACRQALRSFEALGAELVEVELPHTRYAIPTYYIVAMAEASSNLARFDGVSYGRRVDGDGSLQGMFSATREAGFGDEVKRRILLGTYVLSAGYYDAWYGRAQKVRTLVKRDFDEAFRKVDVIAGPTSPTPAFPLGERTADPVTMYLSDVFTVPVSLAGLPALSLPCGRVGEPPEPRLPVGLQLVGPALSDARLLRVASAFEAVTEHHLRRPPLSEPGDGA